MRPLLPLALGALLAACPGAVPRDDAGLPPPRDSDAGADDAGRADAGLMDAGAFDAGASRCDPDAGPEVTRDGGSLVCAPCSSATGCGVGGVCGFVQAATCTGACALYGDRCLDPGPEPTHFRVTVQVDAFGCPSRHPGGCDYVYEVDPATGALTLSLWLLGGDGGVPRAYGTLSTPVAVAVKAASVRDLWCVGERDLFTGRCVDRSAVIRVDAAAPDAGVVVRWPLRAGRLPPEGLHAAVLQVLRAGDAVFRDAGVAWSRVPP